VQSVLDIWWIDENQMFICTQRWMFCHGAYPGKMARWGAYF